MTPEPVDIPYVMRRGRATPVFPRDLRPLSAEELKTIDVDPPARAAKFILVVFPAQGHLEYARDGEGYVLRFPRHGTRIASERPILPEQFLGRSVAVLFAGYADAGTNRRHAKDLETCGDCGRRFRHHDLVPPKRIHERVIAGDAWPSGECPVCGALCFSHDAKAPDFARIDPDRTKCAGCGKAWSADDLLPFNPTFIDPGDVTPAGECPSCRHLCYPVPLPARRRKRSSAA